MTRAKGFCDLNIPSTAEDLKGTVLKAISIGYQTIAINHYVSDTMASTGDKEGGQSGGSKKRKKSQQQKKGNGDENPVPSPVVVELSKQDLERYRITRTPVILSRITITHSDPSSPFLSKYASVIRQYDLVAIIPENDATLKQIVWSKVVDVDIITLSTESNVSQFSRSLLRAAGERDIYFELCYSPCLGSTHLRKQTIILSHHLHRISHAANVIITSQANSQRQLRHPYDVMNVGRFLGLSELAAKYAVSNTAHNAIYCAAARRRGLSKCAVHISMIGQGADDSKFEGLEDVTDFLQDDEDGPATKKTKLANTPIVRALLQETVKSKMKTKNKNKKKKTHALKKQGAMKV